MMPAEDSSIAVFSGAVQGLQRGDFSRLAPLLEDRPLERRSCQIIEGYDKGYFAEEPATLAEALTCACFLGRTGVAEFLLDRGVDPAAGAGTGLNAFHWAANHDVDLVLFVRRLFVRSRRRSEYDVEGAALQDADGALVRAFRDARLSLDEADHTATIGRAHSSLPPPLNS